MVTATVLDQIPETKSPKTRPQRSKAVQQAVDIQQTLYDETQAGQAKGSVLAQLARAWCEVIETKLALQMKPKPKPVDVSALQAAKAKRSAPAKGFSESPEAKQSVQSKDKA